MDAKELANLIKTRVEIIGTDIKHLESIAKYAEQNQHFADAFALLYLSLQNTVFVELFKLFDGYNENENKKVSKNKDAFRHSVYALIEYNGHLVEGKYPVVLEEYKDDILAIKKRRNKIHAHELGNDGEDVYKNNQINHKLQDLLQVIADICCAVDDSLYPNTHCRNVREFDDWCHTSLNAIKETCTLHGKVFTIADVSMDVFYENLDEYLLVLKQKHISGRSDV